jgi:hypothetical protein
MKRRHARKKRLLVSKDGPAVLGFKMILAP